MALNPTLLNMRNLTRAMSDAERHKLARVLGEEDLIKARLRALDDQEKRGLEAACNALAAKLTGVDVSWHTWLESSRRTLNMDLARLQVEKEAVMQRFQDRFGKQVAVEALVVAEQDRHKRHRKKVDEEALLQIFPVYR